MLGLREFQDQKADIILKYDGGAPAGRAPRAPHADARATRLLRSRRHPTRWTRARATLPGPPPPLPTADEARSLKTYGELPDTVQINAGTEMLEGEEFGDDNFDFDEDADANDSHDDIDDI